jgi:hypothetical protein
MLAVSEYFLIKAGIYLIKLRFGKVFAAKQQPTV